MAYQGLKQQQHEDNKKSTMTIETSVLLWMLSPTEFQSLQRKSTAVLQIVTTSGHMGQTQLTQENMMTTRL